MVHLKIHTPPVVYFSKIFHRGCMDFNFKWSSPLSFCPYSHTVPTPRNVLWWTAKLFSLCLIVKWVLHL